MMARKYVPVKCKWCGQKILKEEDRVKIQITEKQSVNVHKHCEIAYKKDRDAKVIENEAWDRLYQYVKIEILGYTKEKQLTPSQRRRLQNLRNGSFVVRGQKITNDGYTYDVILTTFKAKKIEIERATYNKTFEDENHRFNYIMVIVENSIIDIAKKLERAKKEKENEQEIIHTISDRNIEDVFEEYKQIQSTKKEEPKKSNIFEDLW